MRVKQTLEELLASVLAEEGIVLDGTIKVVDHELEDGLNLLLGVTSVDGEGSILSMVSACIRRQTWMIAYPFTTV